MKQTLEQKQREKSRLLKAFRAQRKHDWLELVAREPRIKQFWSDLKKIDSPANVLVYLADSWVRFADPELRYAALRLVNKHCEKQGRYVGQQILDDPMPPATNVFLTAREMLAVR